MVLELCLVHIHPKVPERKEVKNHEYMNHAWQKKQMYRKHEFFFTYEHDTIVKGDNWLPRQYFLGF